MFTITIIYNNGVHRFSYGLLQKKQYEEKVSYFTSKGYKKLWLSDEKNMVFSCDYYL